MTPSRAGRQPSAPPREGATLGPRRSFEAIAVPGLPFVQCGANLLLLICDAIEGAGLLLRDGDVLVIAQKLVSKAEGRYIDLADVTPGAHALRLAEETGKDARLIEVILGESRRVVRHRRGVLIVEHRLGFVVANAGVDQSNVDPEAGREPVLLLPEDPDGSARRMHEDLARERGKQVAVIISDSFGRAWRLGTVGIALGAAGLPALLDLRGRPDLYGRALQVSETGFADEIAAAASLLMGQADEALPVVLVRGLHWSAPAGPAASLVRDPQHDLFR